MVHGGVFTWSAISSIGPRAVATRWAISMSARSNRFFQHRAGKQSIQPGDRSTLKRWLSVFREEGAITSAVLPPLTSHDRIFKEFDASANRARFGPEVDRKSSPGHPQVSARGVPAGEDDLGKISQEEVIRYIERHARDWSPGTGKAMCWSLRAFLRYLHHQGLNPRALAGCVPSIRRWKLTSLPTFLGAAHVQKALDGCDRATAMGKRDYAILMMLAKLGLRAGEVATLTLDDINWRASEMLLRAKGRQRARVPVRRTLARPSLHTCAMAARSPRAGGCSSARLRRISALLPGVRSR